MTAAKRFLDEIAYGDRPRPAGSTVAALRVSLHGSLAFTGVGHGTDRAIILGLCGLPPDAVEAEQMGAVIKRVQGRAQHALHGRTVEDLDLVGFELFSE